MCFHFFYLVLTIQMSNTSSDFSSSFSLLVNHVFALSKIVEAVQEIAASLWDGNDKPLLVFIVCILVRGEMG